MFTPKTKSSPSNLQLVSDEEVATSLERLIDSVVVEVTARRSALQLQQVNESNDGTLDINSLPDDVILEIFGYLKHNQLSQIPQVCRRWSVLVKRPVLWKTVNVEFLPCGKTQNAAAKSFINKLPPGVTSIHLDFTEFENWNRTLDYEKLCVILQERCPDIKALILTNSVLLDSLPAVIEMCSEFLQHVKNLTFHRCIFRDFSTRVEFCGTSRIEVLDVSLSTLSTLGHLYKPQFSRMPCLKVLRLYCANVCDSWFRDEISFLGQLHVLNLGYADISASILPAVLNHGHNLEELYICGLNLEDYDLNFAHLKKICLSNTNVTCENVVSLIQSCPSLQNVYVDEDVAESFAEHPFVVANRCKSGIVKSICFIHKHN